MRAGHSDGGNDGDETKILTNMQSKMMIYTDDGNHGDRDGLQDNCKDDDKKYYKDNDKDNDKDRDNDKDKYI